MLCALNSESKVSFNPLKFPNHTPVCYDRQALCFSLMDINVYASKQLFLNCTQSVKRPPIIFDITCLVDTITTYYASVVLQIFNFSC